MEQDDWKARYKQLSEQMDELQAQLEDQPLVHLVSQMAVALDGQSSILDCSLKALCEQLKTKHSELPNTIRLVEKQLRGLDIDQQQYRNELLVGLHKWIYQLRLNLITDTSQQRLSRLEEDMTPFSVQPSFIVSIINTLVELQEPILTDDFNRGRQRALPDELEDKKDDALLQKIGAELLDLISGMNIPQGEMSQTRALISRIEQGVTLTGLTDIVREFVDLVARLSSYNGAEFEQYLQNLTSQLTEVQSYVNTGQKEDLSAAEVVPFVNGIQQEVQTIQRVMLGSNDLQQLKRDVSSQLQNIIKSVDQFKAQEEGREQRLHERYLQLLRRFELMEEQTQQMKLHVESERHKALTDSLTSLSNRAGYDEQLNAEFSRWKRYGQPFSLAVADLDLFKKINDTYGHQAGDKVLRLVASIFTQQSRTTDFVARYGGEEFVILMPSTTAEKAMVAVEKIRQAVAQSPFNFRGDPVQITLSLGLTQVRPDDVIDNLFDRADKALYKAKRLGRNRIEVG